MSVQAITCALALRGVSSTEKLVLLALANYADEHMQCWPSQQRLADDCCMSERGVRGVLADLESRRVLSREQRRRQDGYRASDRVTLHFAGIITAAAEIILPEPGSAEPASPEPVSAEPDDNLTGTKQQFSPERGAGLTTLEPSVEPSKEPPSFVVSASPKPTPKADEIKIAFEEWNALAERLGLPKARKLDPARRKAIGCRLRDGGLEVWRQALLAVENSPHCRGENDRCWQADLDFVCQAKSWRRLLEGSYGARPGATGPPMTAGMLSAASDELAFRIATGQVNGTENRNPLRDPGAVVALPAPLARHG